MIQFILRRLLTKDSTVRELKSLFSLEPVCENARNLETRASSNAFSASSFNFSVEGDLTASITFN